MWKGPGSCQTIQNCEGDGGGHQEVRQGQVEDENVPRSSHLLASHNSEHDGGVATDSHGEHDGVGHDDGAECGVVQDSVIGVEELYHELIVELPHGFVILNSHDFV